MIPDPMGGPFGMDDPFMDPMMMPGGDPFMAQLQAQQRAGSPADEADAEKRIQDRNREGGYSLALILAGILLFIAWIGVPLGGLGAWFYGPIQGVFATPVYTRWELAILASVFLTIGVACASLVYGMMPRLLWVENDPGVPRTTWLRSIEDEGSYLILTRRKDRRRIRVSKNIATHEKGVVHVCAHVLEMTARPGSAWDIELRTHRGGMNRGEIEHDDMMGEMSMMKDEQLEAVQQGYIHAQLDQLAGGDPGGPPPGFDQPPGGFM